MMRSVVLSSGGLDSTVCAALAKEQGMGIVALSFRYGQNHSVELEASRKVMAAIGVDEHIEVSIDPVLFRGTTLVGKTEGDVPRRPSAGIPSTYVPGRNTIFIAVALSVAESYGADVVVLGVNAVDYSGYPDCRPEYMQAMDAVASLSSKRAVEGRPIRLWAPLLNMSKADIVREAVRLGVDTSATISCYAPVAGRKCGSCDSCRIRTAAFSEAGLEDDAP